MDMPPVYIQTVVENLPNAIIVFNHLHRIKLYIDKLADWRREHYRQLANDLKIKILKRTRWLLKKNPEDFSDEKNEKDRLQGALK